MDLIASYQSEESFNESQIQPELKARQVRSVYLVTYSQVDFSKFPTRKSFAEKVASLFNSTNVKVVQWACSMEKHELTGGDHYHMSIKLNKNKRWLPVKQKMSSDHGVELHFSSAHSNYYSAWKYTTKSDTAYEQSEKHPDLSQVNSPQTKRATKSRINNKTNKTKHSKKSKKLTPSEVSNIIRTKHIETKCELYALAETQRKEGKTDLYDFIITKGSKKVSDLITTTLELKHAPSDLSRSKKSRLEILQECLEKECIEGCNNDWYLTAKDTLQKNSISIETFSNSVKTLLDKGRGKFRNILIIGPANCGKTFMFKPLTQIYNTFINPATSTFAWVGAENAEVIFLNDFRWSAQLIPWHDLLLLLEGEGVHLPAPKTHFANDILLSADTPIFATSSNEIQLVKSGVVLQRETQMMAVRWKVYEFSRTISENEQRELKPCPNCFAKLVLGV